MIRILTMTFILSMSQYCFSAHNCDDTFPKTYFKRDHWSLIADCKVKEKEEYLCLFLGPKEDELIIRAGEVFKSKDQTVAQTENGIFLKVWDQYKFWDGNVSEREGFRIRKNHIVARIHSFDYRESWDTETKLNLKYKKNKKTAKISYYYHSNYADRQAQIKISSYEADFECH